MVAAVTLLAPNYVARARVLAASVAEHQPAWRLVAVVAGADRLPAIPGAHVVDPTWAGIDERELHRRGALFDRQGVVSSLKWPALRALLDAGADVAVLLDADMELLAGIDDVCDLARRHGIVLTPHLLAPAAGWLEEQVLAAGAYNGGFVAVSREGRPFLDWMAERTRRDCGRESPLFFGQRLLDLVPGVFGAHVLRDPGINVMPHRLGGRDLEGERVRLVHFTGFDPAQPEALSRHLPVAGGARVRELYAGYRERLLGAAGDDDERWPFAIDPVTRAAYRSALLEAEAGLDAEPPDPFAPDGGAALRAWLAEPPDLSRWLLALHGLRPDLQAAFPAVPGADSAAFVAWARDKPPSEIPPEFSPA